MKGDRYSFGLRQIASPGSDILSLAEAKRHLYEDDDHNDADITKMIKEATQWIQEQTEIQLIEASYTMTLDRFPKGSRWLELPLWPLISVDQIQYETEAGSAAVDLSSVVTRINAAGRGRIARSRWNNWPSTLDTPDAVQIDFTCGHSTADDVPDLYKRCALLLIGHWYENRSAVEVGQVAKEIELGARAILDSMRPEDDLAGFDLC